MAGWDQYVTNLTSQGISHAGIFGADGSRWAASANFPVSNSYFCSRSTKRWSVSFSLSLTLQNIDNLREELPKAFSPQPTGILVNGEKYIFIRNQDNFAVFRKSADGMVIVKLNQGKREPCRRLETRILLFQLILFQLVSIKSPKCS